MKLDYETTFELTTKDNNIMVLHNGETLTTFTKQKDGGYDIYKNANYPFITMLNDHFNVDLRVYKELDNLYEFIKERNSYFMKIILILLHDDVTSEGYWVTLCTENMVGEYTDMDSCWYNYDEENDKEMYEPFYTSITKLVEQITGLKLEDDFDHWSNFIDMVGKSYEV